MLKQRFGLRLIVGSLLASLVVGCAPLKLPKRLALPMKSDKPQTPQRITALWTDTVLVEAGIVGFGGRVMFYGRDDEEPVVVAGELTVFAYDDTQNPGSSSAPARKFVFRSEELSKHYSKSSLGHSYSFWLPWGPVGGPKRQISLVTRFKSDAGGVVMSEMTKHFLPGSQDESAPPPTVSQKTVPALRPLEEIRQASHAEPLEERAEPKAGMTTATINLPPGQSGSQAQTDRELSQTDAATGGEPSEPARIPAASAAEDRAGSQDLVREIRALREAIATGPATSPSDRFGRRRFPARIPPKLPPTRDPAKSPLRLAESQSDRPRSTQAATSSEFSANSATGAPTSLGSPQAGQP
jgi:hypothetical protein